MIGPGFAYKTCDCEDFPCCGHNDVDPNWEPDPYDEYDRDYDDSNDTCVLCGDDAEDLLDGDPLCGDCLADQRFDDSRLMEADQ